jgi:uncharacterized membrane protein YjgN (DUF898 family)
MRARIASPLRRRRDLNKAESSAFESVTAGAAGFGVDVSTYGQGGGPEVRPVFHGTTGAMAPTVLKGLALTTLTLGVYRFWYQTNIRRFLWDNTEIGGDGLEYTGRGVELFIGFLIALAVLVPLYGLLFLLSLPAGPIGGAALQYGWTAVLLVLAQYALFRARRYRLTRTVWRGVRFQQTGSGWAYAGRWFGWTLLSLATLGLAYPWMRASLERYKVVNTWYGDQQGAFSATGGQLFRRGAWLWLSVLVTIAAAGFFVAAAAGVAGERGAMDPEGFGAAAAAVASGLVVVGALAVAYALLQAIEFRWWASGSSIGPASARSDLGLFAFFGVYLGYLAAVLLLGAIVFGVGWVVLMALRANGVFASAELGGAQVAAMAVGVLGYLVAALIFAALWQLFVVRPIWRKSFESVSIAGLAELTAAQSAAPAAGAFGEGVADALDFGGF